MYITGVKLVCFSMYVTLDLKYLLKDQIYNSVSAALA